MNPETAWTVSSVITLMVGVLATVALFGVFIWLHTKDGQE